MSILFVTDSRLVDVLNFAWRNSVFIVRNNEILLIWTGLFKAGLRQPSGVRVKFRFRYESLKKKIQFMIINLFVYNLIFGSMGMIKRVM